MVLEQAEVVVSLVLSVISFLAWIYTFGFKMGAMETKLSTLWDVYVKDALSEVTRMHSSNPKKVNVLEFFNDSLKDGIRKTGLHRRDKAKHDGLVMEIEKKYGDLLMKIATDKKVPYRLILGAAILFAQGSIK